MNQLKDYKYNYDYPDLETVYNFENKQLTPFKNKINYVVTHGNCTDGFMSATIVWRWFKEQGINTDTIKFYNAYHGSDFSVLPEQMRDKYVLICDFSFQKPLFNKMLETTHGNILVLDHHKTAKNNLENVDARYLTFDMNHCGAFITWTYFYGFNNIPKTILYVEDNDIWIKGLPCTEEFTAMIYGKKFEFEEYERFFDENYLMETVFPEGKGMVQQNNIYIQKLCKKGVPHFMEINNRYYFVPCLNSEILRSELGHNLLNVYKNANFSMIYTNDIFNGFTTISYRSLNDRSDSSIIAALSEGGGHRNASGSMIHYKISNPPGRIIDSSKAYWLMDNVYVITINDRKFIALNHGNMHTSMCQYLMQERYHSDEKNRNKERYDNNLPGFQEGMFCMRTRSSDYKLNEYYHGAVVWVYDGFLNRYKLTIKFLPGYLENVKNNINVFNKNIVQEELIEYVEKKNDTCVLKFNKNYSLESVLKLCL